MAEPDPLDPGGLNPIGGAPIGEGPIGPLPEGDEEDPYHPPVEGGGGPAGPMFTRRRFRRIMRECREDQWRYDEDCKRKRKKVKALQRAEYLARVRTSLPIAPLGPPPTELPVDPMEMLRAHMAQADQAAHTARQMQASQQQMAIARHQAMLEAQRDDDEAHQLLMVA